MHLRKIADAARRCTPRFLFNLVRKLANAVLGPLSFSLQTGHLRSAFKSAAVDKHGKPFPWFAFPAIQFLLASDFAGKRVLEWGAGQSTLFWARRAKEVVALEHDRVWADILRPQLPANATLQVIQENMSDYDVKLTPGKFDVIIVDGLDRYKSAQLSLPLLADGGVIIVDNSDGNHGEENAVSGADFPDPGDPTKRYGIINLYADNGLSRVDFYGYAPGMSWQQSTSIFFKGTGFLFQRRDVPAPRLTETK